MRTKDGQLDPNHGLLALPEPSDGDLFFDIEGDPFAFDDGVDYLFGVLEPAMLDDEGAPTFHSFWAIDERDEVTPEVERRAFEAFVDLVMDRRAKDPNLHVYHYASYEPSAMSSGPHHQDSGEAKIRESTAGVSRKPSSDCKACGCSSKHLCGLTAWNT